MNLVKESARMGQKNQGGESREPTCHAHIEAAGAQEELKLERWSLSASAQFEHKQGLFEGQHRIMSESITKLECEINKFCSTTERPGRIGKKNIDVAASLLKLHTNITLISTLKITTHKTITTIQDLEKT